MTAPDPLAALRGRGPFDASQTSPYVWDGEAECCAMAGDLAFPIAAALNYALEADATIAAQAEQIDSLQASLAALREAVRPWVVCEMGIPENWPEDCPLTFEIQPRRQGNVVHRTDVVFNYLPMPCQGIAPLIKDYRALARAMEA